MLVTSRQALNISGEVVHRLPSLSFPAEGVRVTAASAQNYGAVMLFADRARAADTRFALTDDNVSTVGDICRRLDGIPLAIELAAVRVRVFSAANIAQQINDRFKKLTGGSRNALGRQKTLGAMIDWSYDLLDEREQTLFILLGVFDGGFGADAAVGVCVGSDLDELDISHMLGSLVEKSLVVAETSGDQERYRLLESTADYAMEKLLASGRHQAVVRHHTEYFHNQARAAAEQYGTGSALAWLAGVDLELDNYRASLDWALTNGNDVVVGGTMAAALIGLWTNAGLGAEGRYWIERALERVSETEHPRIAASLRLALSVLARGKRQRDEGERAKRLYESVGDGRGRRGRSESAPLLPFKWGASTKPAKRTLRRSQRYVIAVISSSQNV